MCAPAQMILNPAGYASRKIGGTGGLLLDPLATAGEKIGGPVGFIIDPARGFDKMMKAPEVDRAPIKGPEEIRKDVDKRVLAQHDQLRKKQSQLLFDAGTPDSLINAPNSATTNLTNLDSMSTVGMKTLLGQ